MKNDFVVFFTVCLICHLFRATYEVLKNNDRLPPCKKTVFWFMACNMAILWLSWFMMCESPQPQLPGCVYMQYTGLVIFISGLILCILPVIKMRGVEGYRGELIQTGIFSKLRHPMYLGFICWIVGYSIYMKAGWSLLSGLIFIPGILFMRHMEEKRLMKRYDGYAEYKKKTFF